jgi:hypothetical protein
VKALGISTRGLAGVSHATRFFEHLAASAAAFAGVELLDAGPMPVDASITRANPVALSRRQRADGSAGDESGATTL